VKFGITDLLEMLLNINFSENQPEKAVFSYRCK